MTTNTGMPGAVSLPVQPVGAFAEHRQVAWITGSCAAAAAASRSATVAVIEIRCRP